MTVSAMEPSHVEARPRHSLVVRMTARRRGVDKDAVELAPELLAIIDALAKEQAKRDHYAEQAKAGADRDRSA